MFSLGAQRSCGGGAFAAALVSGRDRVAAALAEPRKAGQNDTSHREMVPLEGKWSKPGTPPPPRTSGAMLIGGSRFVPGRPFGARRRKEYGS